MKHVLIVDNNPVILTLVKNFLQRENFKVSTAVSGLDALDILEREVPDYIFTDLVMPQINGKKLCRIIRAMDKLQNIPIVIISGIAKESDLDPADYGAVCCIAKGPNLTGHILATIRQLEKKPDSIISKIGYEEVFEREISREMLSSRKHYDIIFNNLDVGIFELTSTDKIIYANPFAIGLFGVPETDLLGRSFVELFAEQDVGLVVKALADAGQNRLELSEEKGIKVNDRSLSLSFIAITDVSYNSIVVLIRDVTKNLQAEIDLQNSTERFRIIFENSPDAILWFNYDTGIIINCNSAAESLFARKANEFIGRHRSILYGGVRAGDFAHLFKKENLNGHIPKIETEIETKSGRIVPVEVALSYSSVNDMTIVQGVFTDISVRKVAQEKLNDTNEYLRSLLDSVQAGIVVIDEETRTIVDVNPVAARMIGLSKIEIIGQGCNDIICQGSVGRCAADGDQCSKKLEHLLNNAGGRKIPVLITSTIQNISGQKFIIVSFVDITWRKKLEERLRKLSITDELTGILNRRGFITLAEQHIKVADRKKAPFYLLFVDVNDMKSINDNWGHHAGDQALVQVAEVLQMFRESDIIGRLGGDEFVALLNGNLAKNDNLISEEIIAGRVNSKLAEIKKRHFNDFDLSISIGIIRYDPFHPCSLDELISKADMLMYENKMKST